MFTAIDQAEREKRQIERATDIHCETAAMYDAFIALEPLDYNARKRVLRWLGDALENCEVPF